MNILITGVAGLIGSRFADYLLKTTDNTVVGIDCLEEWGNCKENIPDGVIFFKRDLSRDSVRDIFEQYHFDLVYHFAAYAAEGLSPFMRMFNYSNNIGATVNIINECIRFSIKRLIYTSSMSVYGHGVKPGTRFTEEDPLAPIDPYGTSKFACENDIKIAGEQHGLDWCIIRPHNVFGANQNVNDRYRNVLGIWMHQIYHGEPILVYGDGNQTRAFTEVTNILPCLLTAGVADQCSKQIINLGGIKEFTINEAANILCDITGYDNIIHLEQRHEVKYAVPTFQKSIDLLDYKEDISFKDGLANMWEWAKNGRIHDWFVWNNFELDKGIYSYWKK